MIRRLFAISGVETLILFRNRWIAVSALLMAGFCLLIALAGSAPVGTIGVDRLSATAASLSTLLVYLVPLLALLVSYDSISGEAARGTLPLLVSYPVRRSELLAGKFIAQFAILSLSIMAGIVLVAAALTLTSDWTIAGLGNLFTLAWTACLLGAVFLAVGGCISAFAREPGTAAALAIAVWIVAVVMYDIALLAALVNDDGGVFTTDVFPWMLVANPPDAFRLFNLARIESSAVTGGIATAASNAPIPSYFALVTLLAWFGASAIGATFFLRRYQP